MPDLDTMPIEDVRDEVARMLGFNPVPDEYQASFSNAKWCRAVQIHKLGRGSRLEYYAENPVSTLDAVAALLPEAWWFGLNYCALCGIDTYVFEAVHKKTHERIESRCASELEARLRCLAKCLAHKSDACGEVTA